MRDEHDGEFQDRDPAQYREASYEINVAESDRPEDIIRDAVESVWPGSPPATKNEFLKLAKAAAIAILRSMSESGKLAAITKDVPTRTSDLLKGVVGEIIASKNPAMMAQCVDVAFNLGVLSGNETEIAKRFGVTRAAISYRCCQLVETYLNGNPSPGMRSEETKRKYSNGRKGKCAKQAAPPWEFKNKFCKAFADNPIKTTRKP